MINLEFKRRERMNAETQRRGAVNLSPFSVPLRLCVHLFVCLTLIALLQSGCTNFTSFGAKKFAPTSWPEANAILARISPPKFPDRKFPITSYGAIAGETNDSSDAIRKAIDACYAAGGGHVIVPAGTFLTGPITLKSNVDLHLEEGSTLLFKTDPNAYLPAVLTRYEGMEFYNYSPFIYAMEQQNIAVTGSGTLDGQASQETWWGWTRRMGQARNRLTQMVADNVPVEQRRFGDGDFMRPNFFQPYRCKNVMVEGVHIRRSPMWEINPVLCANVIIRNLDIVSHGPNNDGADPECCTDVLIEGCLFDTGDDCIAIKSGRNNDGRRIGVAASNHIIRNCSMKDGHGGVTIGSEISGSCRNVFVENCTMDSPNLDRVFRFKSNLLRGGVIENIHMRNVTVGRVGQDVLQIDFVYEGNPQGPFVPLARNISMENVTVKQTPRILNVVGCAGSTIDNVRLIHCTFENVQRADVVRDAQDVQLINCKVDRAAPATQPVSTTGF
jgi:polygalacturonase